MSSCTLHIPFDKDCWQRAALGSAVGRQTVGEQLLRAVSGWALPSTYVVALPLPIIAHRDNAVHWCDESFSASIVVQSAAAAFPPVFSLPLFGTGEATITKDTAAAIPPATTLMVFVDRSPEEPHVGRSVLGALTTPRVATASVGIDAAATSTPVLMVGAGGIGCELLKNLVKLGFRHITAVDLDTIDGTNLNRQFLFRPRHVGMSKALVAARVASAWIDPYRPPSDGELDARDLPAPTSSPSGGSKVLGILGNIRDAAFDGSFFRLFRVVVNGLDNVAARKHVNRMCMAAGVPLVESGTMGYNGQVQPIVRGRFECYDCRPKPPDQKTFAVCTIHARPTTMVHCVHFAKELYERLFGVNRGGGGADDGDEAAAAAVEQKGEFDRVAGLLGRLWTSLRSPLPAAAESIHAAAIDIFDELFGRRIQAQRELLMAAAASAASVSSAAGAMAAASSVTPLFAVSVDNGERSGASPPPTTTTTTKTPLVPTAWAAEPIAFLSAYLAQLLKDSLTMMSKNLPLVALRDLFCVSLTCLEDRNRREASGQRAFSKDDPAAMLFVAVVANVRAQNFGIHPSPMSFYDLRTMAGSIVPAIASTNAVIAACAAAQAVSILTSPSASPQQHYVALRHVAQRVRRALPPSLIDPTTTRVRRGKAALCVFDDCLLTSFPASPPVAGCIVCSDDAIRRIAVKANLRQLVTADHGRHEGGAPPPRISVSTVAVGVPPPLTLGDFVRRFLMKQMSLVSPTVAMGPRVLYEHEDFEDLIRMPLLQLSAPPPPPTSGADDGLKPQPSPLPLPLPAFDLSIGDLNQTLEWTVTVNDAPSYSVEEDEAFCLVLQSGNGCSSEPAVHAAAVLLPDATTTAANQGGTFEVDGMRKRSRSPPELSAIVRPSE